MWLFNLAQALLLLSRAGSLPDERALLAATASAWTGATHVMHRGVQR